MHVAAQASADWAKLSSQTWVGRERDVSLTKSFMVVTLGVKCRVALGDQSSVSSRHIYTGYFEGIFTIFRI